MANMNIKTEKILSPSNIKRIIMLGVGLRDQLSNMELGLISDYDNTKTYTRGQAVYYNNYLYKCLYTTTGDFDESKWQLIGDDLDLVTKADIEAMLGLTQEEIASLQSLISTEIRLDKCFSSSDTYNRLLTVENECKKFTLEQLAKKAGVVYKVVADTTGVDSTEFLYLISNGSNGYNIYAYIDGSAVKISDTNINLDSYAKLSDLNNYYDKATSDGKYATITTVDGKVDKTSILSAISSNPSDDNLLSEKAIKSELNTINTNLDDKVDKASITTTIDSSSTDDTIPSSKAVFNPINNIQENLTSLVAVTDLNNFKGSSFMIGRGTGYNDATTNVPNGVYGAFVVEYIPYHTGDMEGCQRLTLIQPMGGKYVTFERSLNAGNWTSWQRLCSTSVADVPVTDITFSSTTNYEIVSECKYFIKNGICTTMLYVKCNTPVNAWTTVSNVPKPLGLNKYDILGSVNGDGILKCVINSNGLLQFSKGTSGTDYIGTFSYPVAES